MWQPLRFIDSILLALLGMQSLSFPVLLKIPHHLLLLQFSLCEGAAISSVRRWHNGLLSISNFSASPTIVAREENLRTTYWLYSS
jgi:hypothetical protein